MKEIIFIALGFILITSACNQTAIDESKQERDSLVLAIKEQQEAINDFMSSFNDVERNLNAVAAKQHIIALNSASDFKSNQKSRINSEIQAINTLMDENQTKIVALSSKFKGSSIKNVQLEKTIAILTNQLTIKYAELNTLNEKLNTLNADVEVLLTRIDTLIAQNTSNSETLAEKIKETHTAYYVIGKAKYLRNEKLIDSKGGLLGIGTTPILSKDFDTTKFTRIDYTQVNGFPINGNAIKIITNHPTDSYTINRDNTKNKKNKTLTITNPTKFWSLSKYLVIASD